MTAKLMTAKFHGRCGRCSEKILPGEKILWTRGGPSIHADRNCVPRAMRGLPERKLKAVPQAKSTAQVPAMAPGHVVPNTMVPPVQQGKDINWWKELVRASVAQVTEEQVDAIARIAMEQECGVWHASYTYAKQQGNLNATCSCQRCRPGVRYV